MSNEPRTTNTDRLYAAAQEAFRSWCRNRHIRFPASHDDIANYLRFCAMERGTSVVPVHLSAIARLYRDRGWRLDTKAGVIQEVVAAVRAGMRAPSRIDLRLPAETKQLIEHAAAIRGVTVSDFVISTAYRAAQKVMRDDAKWKRNRSDSVAFVDAMSRPLESVHRNVTNG